MSETELVTVGDPMPRIGSSVPEPGCSVRIRWSDGMRAGREDHVDLAPEILTFRYYRPLREHPELFGSVRPSEDGAALVWGANGEIEMPATAVERLAEETMTPTDFSAFLTRHGLTLEAAGNQLGISPRLVAHYASGWDVPRYIALACRYIDLRDRAA